MMIVLDNKVLTSAIANDEVGRYVVLLDIDRGENNEPLRIATGPTNYTYNNKLYRADELGIVDVSVSDDEGIISREAFTISIVDTDRQIHSEYSNRKSIKIEVQFLAIHRDERPEPLGIINWTGGTLSHVTHTLSKNNRGTEATGITTLSCIGLFPKLSAVGTRRTTKASQDNYLRGVPDNIFDSVGVVETRNWGYE